MSQDDDDLELQALQRRLDDAFQTTRPRTGFEDELWLRVQASRPAPRRLRDALAAFWSGVRAVPAVPAAATALVLVVALGIGIFALSGIRPGGSGASTTSSSGQYSARELAPVTTRGAAPGDFGRLPAPAFSGSLSPTPAMPPLASGATPAAGNTSQYTGPVRYTWTGSLSLNVTTVPVFRYQEPGSTDADQFASALGAVLRDRPEGFLGSYSAADYTLKVRGTIKAPPSSPAYFIFSGLNLPPVDTAGGPQAVADVFLAQHSLAPPWPYTVSVDSSADPTRVTYERQFTIPGYGPAYLVDFNGDHYGLEVDLSGGRPVLASGMLPLNMDVANYNVISADDAIRTVLGPPDASRSQLPAVELSHAELVYVLVPAGDHSFFEPAFVFTGTLRTGGQSYTRHVLISAIEPTQRAG